MAEYQVLLTGTDPQSRLGGIGFALQGYIDALEDSDIAWCSIPTYSPENFAGKWWLLLKNLPQLVRKIRDCRAAGQVPIVYSHPGAGASLVREAIVLNLARTLGAKTVVQVHAPEMLRYFKYPLIRYSLLAILRRVDKVNVLSPWWSTYFMQYLAADRLAVIPNPLPQAWEQVARTALPDKEGAGGNTKLLAMSRLEPGKGVDLVVEAMAHLPGNFRLTVAGSGSLAAPLSRRARELGLSERIEFTGWVSGIDKQRLLESADLFVLPSSNDSFGMGFVEAMANGLPVVALHWGPIGDIVPNGRAGVLVENPCSVELAEAIVTLADRDTRRRMGEAGKQWVIEAFAAQKIGQRLRLEFDELILSP